jgi:hypothetical protein
VIAEEISPKYMMKGKALMEEETAELKAKVRSWAWAVCCSHV